MGIVSSPGAVYDAYVNSFERELDGDSSTNHWTGQLAGYRIDIRSTQIFPCDELIRSLAHLYEPYSGEAELKVLCFSTSDSAMYPGSPWNSADLAISGSHGSDGVRLFFEKNQYRLLSTSASNLLVYNAHEHTAVMWTKDDQSHNARSVPTLFRMLLHWFMSSKNLLLVHAAAIGDEQGLVLITGPGGAGKSTTSLICLNAGLGFCGDDYCIVAPAEKPMVYSMASTARASAYSLGLLGNALKAGAYKLQETDEKYILDLQRTAPQSILRNGSVRGIISCRISDRKDCAVAPTSSGEVFRALAPYTLFQSPGDREKSIRRMMGLVMNCPSWRLELGRDCANLPSLISKTIDVTLP